MALSYSTITLLAVVAVLLRLLHKTVFKNHRSHEKKHPFPTGPSPLPWLGNIHQIPPAKAFLAFTSWGRDKHTSTASGLVGLRLGPQGRAVILNKWTHVRDLFDSREKGAIYADRPYFTAADHVLPPPGGADLHLAFARYGPGWRRARRTMTEFLTEKEVDKLTYLQDAESSQMVWELLRHCGPPGGNNAADDNNKNKDGVTEYYRYTRRYFTAVILASVFGQRGKASDAQSKVRRFYAIQDDWSRMMEVGGSPPFDAFPWLRHVPDVLTPWRGWAAQAADVKRRQSVFYHELFAECEARFRAGKSHECFMARVLQKQDAAARAGRAQDLYSPLELDYIGGFLMEAGADTTAVSFESFLLAMAAYPEVQREAQKEVDAVFGPDEMPHKTDGTKLPYVKACFLETLRWRNPMPTVIPHANTADDVYQGYSIPKGTTMIANVWAISHDPDDFKDPDTYNPGRYIANKFGIKTNAGRAPLLSSSSGQPAGGIGKDSSLNRGGGGELDEAAFSTSEVSSHQGRRQTYAFGAGRRVCAGSKMAENSMMFTMAKVLWAFDVIHAPGGVVTKPEVEVGKAFKDSILTGPHEFPVMFRLRDERKRHVIEREWEKADEMLRRFE